MSVHRCINLILLGVALLIAAWVLVEVLRRDWLPGSHDRAMAAYLFPPAEVTGADVTLNRVFAEMRAALEAGCVCGDCTYTRVLLAGYGINVEAL